MRWLCFTAVSAALCLAQLPSPNASGVTMGHMHIVVTDPDAQKKAWIDVLGAQTVKTGALELIKLPGVFIVATKAQKPPSGGTDGSVVNHLGLVVKDYADIKAKATAAKLAVRELTPNQQAFVTLPEDVTIEIQEDKSISAPVMFHHIHMSVPDQEAARAWYVKEFGAGSGSRRNMPAAMIPGGEVDFLRANMPVVPTRGRSLDHIGFEVKNLAEFLKKLEADGVTINMPFRDVQKQVGLNIAFVTDPNGTYIELTEGLAGK